MTVFYGNCQCQVINRRSVRSMYLHRPINQQRRSSHVLQEQIQSKSCKGFEGSCQLQESCHNEWQSTNNDQYALDPSVSLYRHAYKNSISTYVTDNLGIIISARDLACDSKDSIGSLFIVNDIQNNLVTLAIDNHYSQNISPPPRWVSSKL